MILDPTEEIKAIRHRLAADFDFDLHRIIADIRKQQEESGRTYIRLPRRVPRTAAQLIGDAHCAVSPEIASPAS
jgi:hypothetical protein